MKYVDAEKLIAEIERRRLSNRYIDTEDYENELLEIIDSLQQEQPNDLASLISEATTVAKRIVDRDSFYNSLPQNLRNKYTFNAWCEILEALSMMKKQEQSEPSCKICGFYENNCPFIRDTFKPYPNKVCKDYTYSVMKEQEQPEVDLKKEIDTCWQNWLSPSNQKEVEGVLPKIEFAMYARHFYELGGLNARKEK